MLQPYGEEESLSSAGLEELLPLVGVPHGEGDWVDSVLELGGDGARPLIQLEAKKHILHLQGLTRSLHQDFIATLINRNKSPPDPFCFVPRSLISGCLFREIHFCSFFQFSRKPIIVYMTKL